MVDCYRAFASHINVPKGNWDVYHEPFKDTCMESENVIDDCNKHAQTSESTISYKHVNFCEHLDLVKRIKSKKIIVSTTGMKN
jgi:hypothetical protein